MRTTLYHRHCFPAKIISHCVWLDFRFALSFRDVEEMLAMRGIALTYETVRECALSFVRLMPMAYVTSLLAPVTNGISTKCFSRSMAASITSCV